MYPCAPKIHRRPTKHSPACHRTVETFSSSPAQAPNFTVRLSNLSNPLPPPAQDALEVDTFSSSDEAFAAEALFDAYRTGDPDAVVALVKKNYALGNLDNQVGVAVLRWASFSVVREITLLTGGLVKKELRPGQPGQPGGAFLLFCSASWYCSAIFRAAGFFF